MTRSPTRQESLRKLLEEGSLSTQEELKSELERLRFKVTQSTVSRDLRRLGAIKTLDSQGRTIYRMNMEPAISVTGGPLYKMIVSIRSNDSMIVIRTQPGSASLIARHLDQVRPAGILGTIAGDDTIFVAPASAKKIRTTIQEIHESL